jgi:hypothetical protein
MMPRQIIAEAWKIAQREKQLKRWGFAASFFATLLNVKLIGYQLYFLHAYMVGNKVGFFDDFIWLYYSVPVWAFFTIGITFGVLLLIEFVMPNLTKGAIIGLSAKAHCKQEVKGGFVLALYNFFPMLAIHEFLVLASWSMVLTICSLILRYIEGQMAIAMVCFVIFFFVLSNILKFFFSFAEPAIVVQKAGIFEAMGQSFKLVVSYLGRVMFLLLLLFVISIRIMINTMIILVIPSMVIGFGFLLGFVLSPVLSYTVAGILGIGLIVAASYLFAYLEVFKEAVWTITYIELKRNKDLDVIE